PTPAPTPTAASGQNEERLLNMTALRERFAEDEIKMLFGIVEDSLGGELKKLREGLAQNDDKVVASVAHAFKGASMSIEATTLYELLYELEKAAKASDSASFAGLAEKIEVAFTETIEVIRRYK
ncbi:MAG: Hpt domain-containing protein, partial [Cyanobacteria bacterium HKST-UBA02]|nr:Hpt domain-containing protein [Cyanobacteria bacterium HKST-UBA02]